MSALLNCLKQFKILCWKNFLLDKTHYILVPAQLITPVVMILIVFIIRQTIPKSYGNETYYDGFSFSHKDIFYAGSQVYRRWVVAYCPSDVRVEAIMKGIMARTEGFLVVVNESKFDNETEMVRTILSNSTYKNLVFAGVVFDVANTSDGGYNVTYKLRFPAEQNWKSSDKSTWLTDSWYETEPRMAPRTVYYRGNIAKPGYLREGFLFLQRYIDDAIINLLTRNTPLYDEKYDPLSHTQLKMFPYPGYKADDFIDVVRTYLPLFIIISFLINATIIAKEVTLEKEKKLKESMKLMGLKVWINWCAWFAKFFLFALISVSVIIFFLHLNTYVGAVFNYSDPSVTFVFLTLYSTSVITFGFMMSAIFSKANVAAATTSILYLMSYIPYYFMQIYYKDLGLVTKIMFSFFNNLAMSYGCLQFSRFEALGVGMTWSNLGNKEMAQDEMTLQYVMIMLAVDSVLYSILTWYFDAIFPGDFGVPQPFYFPVMPWYWCGHKVQSSAEEFETEYGHTSDAFEKPDKTKRVGVRIRGLTKMFNKAQKPAVNSFNLDLYEGNITVFLGHNGAGKTTTMFMLAGFLKPTSGTVIISGHDISKHMDRVRQSLGLCPQHNILFDTLTVEQHLYFFAQMKGCSNDELRLEIDQMIHMLNLQDKRDVMASSLSGGMKRKLSIAIALIGGSRFVILDEPTSGMDPESRRQTWEILQQQRRGRTIIISTHFMDEADLLGDRIAVISNGEVECYGSPIFLKSRYGIGYHLTIVKGKSTSTNDITALITEHLDDARFESEMGAELTYLLPKADSKKLSKLFKAIESEKVALGIEGFGASVTTMEEVFLKVAEMATKHKEHSKLGTSFSQALRYIPSSSSLNEHKEKAKKSYCFQSMPTITSTVGGHLSQLHSLFLKKILNSLRNRPTTAFQLILPLIFALLACSVIHSLPKKTDMPPLALTSPPISSVASASLYKTPYYISPGSSAAWIRCLEKVFPSFATKRINISVAANRTFYFNSSSQQSIVDQYLMGRAKRALYKYQKNYLTAIEILGDFDTIRGYFNDESYHAIAVTVNKLSNMRLCRMAQSSTSRRNVTDQINTINHPLPWRAKNGLVGMSTINNLLLTAGILSNSVAFGMGLAMGTFILFIINERSSGAKHIQYLTGASPLAFWGTALIWDLVNYLVPTFMVVIVIVGFQTEGYFENIGLVFMLIIFYFWSMIFIIYCLSLVVPVASTGYIVVTVVNIFTGTVANLTIAIMKYPTFKVVGVAMKLEWFLYAVFPNFCLNRGLFDLFFNYQSLKICNSLDDDFNLTQICNYSAEAKETNPCCPEICGDACLFRSENYLSLLSPGIGRPILFMALQSLIFCFILAVAEYMVLQNLFSNSFRNVQALVVMAYPYVSYPKSPSMTTNNTDICFFDSSRSSFNDPAIFPTIRLVEAEDDDVFMEKNRTLSMLTRTIEAGEHALVLRDVSKNYGNFLAVDRLSLTVSKGECFGLLGVNGAGKTTTFKMMTGALNPSAGEIFIQGINVAKHTRAAQSLVGYCPQFDALIDQLTVGETLYMFALLRKLDPVAIPYVVDNFIDVLLLEDHRKKMAGNLSGGNKRKLCIGIALMGSPPIIFLDEPTTGMDPAARRNLWNTLTAVRESGKTIVLTSHSMEECEALCTRLAIMVNGKFKCLGSTHHLKTKFGGGYTVIIKQKPNKKRELMEYYARLIMNFMDRVFPGNHLKDRHEGILYFQTDDPNLTLARIFEVLEKAKSSFEIEDYSVSQTTLEQLFINFAKTQRDR